MYVLVVYIPQSHLEIVKEALFASGGGVLGNYTHCCWETKGTGQFLPNENANPAIGVTGVLETVIEYRVEMVVQESSSNAVIQALKDTHPYETPAYHIIEVIV